jgi:hypothetical protein
MASHDRRLDKLEEHMAPRGRTVVILHREGRDPPGHVERERARLLECGSVGSRDQILVIHCKRFAKTGQNSESGESEHGNKS